MPEITTQQYNIFDLGFNKHLVRGSSALEFEIEKIADELPLPSILGSGFFEIPPSQLGSGELGQNLTMVAGLLQSANFVSGSAGWRILYDGTVEFNSGVFRGSLVAGSIHIPDQDTTANSFHTDSDGNTWWGCTETDFNNNNNNAIAYILKTGVAKLQSLTVVGGIIDGATTIGGSVITTVLSDISGNTTSITTNASGISSNVSDISGNTSNITQNATNINLRVEKDDVINQINISAEGILIAGIRISLDGDTTVEGTFSATTGRIGGWYLEATTLADNDTPANANVLIDSANSLIRLGPVAGTTITIDGANQKIESSNYVSGAFGAGFHLSADLLETGNAAIRGIIRTAVFQKDVISVVGGNIAILDGDVLATDMDATDAETLTIEGNTTFVVNDILRIKDGTDDEWMTVTNIASAPTYTVTRDEDSAYGADANPTWKKGASVVNYGASGEGGIYMTASETNAPYLSVFTHAGSPWDVITTWLRIGNLNGYLGYSSDKYGIAIGETNKFLKYDPTNGLQIRGKVTIESGSTGVANLGDAGSLAVLSVIGNAYITDLAVDKLTAGTILSKAIILAVDAGVGDAYISAGKTDFDNTVAGFILGLDDSDSDRAKLYIGDSSIYFNWTGVALTIVGAVITAGTFQTAASGERIEITASYFSVFDNSEDLRMRIQGHTLHFYDENEANEGYISSSTALGGMFTITSSGTDLALRSTGSAVKMMIGNDTYVSLVANNLTMGDLTAAGKSYIHIKGDDDSDNDPGCLVLYDHAGTPYYLWVDNTGDLRIHTSAPTDEAADGAIVGSQS